MKRYLCSYSRNTVTIRDRKTNQQLQLNHITDDVAKVYTDAISETNYHLNSKKHGKVYIKTFDNNNYTSKKTCTKWGDIQPDKIKWATSWYNPDEKPKTKTEKLSNELNKLLEI